MIQLLFQKSKVSTLQLQSSLGGASMMNDDAILTEENDYKSRRRRNWTHEVVKFQSLSCHRLVFAAKSVIPVF